MVLLVGRELCATETVEKEGMIFPQKERFDERTSSKTVGYIAPKSELSHQGVKIVDSWVSREHGERLPRNLTLRNGFLIPVESKS
jgi:hypothetical protein